MATTTHSHSHFFRIALLFCLGMTCLAGHSAPATTNAVPETDGKAAEEAFITNQESLRSYLQIQEQLHTLQVANEKNRLEAEAAAARNAELLQMQMDGLQKSIITQRRDELNELKVIHQSNGHVLVAAGAFLAIGFLVLLSAIFFQWNVVNRLTAVAASLPEHPMLGPGRAAAALGMGEGSQLPGPSSVEESNNRFLAIVERLEQRLLDMEAGSRPPLADDSNANGSAAVIAVSHEETNGADAETAEPAEAAPETETSPEDPAPAVSEHKRTITSLIGKGQTLLKLDQAEAALACFDEILSLDPGNTDALVKKGAALERLQRLNEAIDCYDRAIATDNSMTMAYLYKGGVFNRMERYTEALECYERALKTQDKAQIANIAVS